MTKILKLFKIKEWKYASMGIERGLKIADML